MHAGRPSFCEVHHAFMRAVEVPGPKAALPVTQEYLAAKAKLVSPHLSGFHARHPQPLDDLYLR